MYFEVTLYSKKCVPNSKRCLKPFTEIKYVRDIRVFLSENLKFLNVVSILKLIYLSSREQK